jgi:hypothetical protein
MATCPNCKTDVTKRSKNWKYGQFTVNAYACPRAIRNLGNIIEMESIVLL